MESYPIVYIRTDANRYIATGHVMRCLTIAREVTRLGGQVTFVVSDQESKKILANKWRENEDYPVICTQVDYRMPEKELPGLLEQLEKEEVFCLLIDSYYVTEHYMKTVRKKVKTAYLDDLGLFDYPADIIINYDAGVNQQSKIAEKYRLAKILLLGEQYAPLRESFQQTAFQVRKNGKAVLISTGGSDQYHFMEEVLNYLWKKDRATDYVFHVIIGSLHDNISQIEALAERDPRIVLHRDVEQMAELMVRCDTAISAAGTTLFELCALGIPAISFSMSDNQILCAGGFQENGCIPYGGDIREGKEAVVKRVVCDTIELLRNSDQRERISRHMKEQHIGAGAVKIAEMLMGQEKRT